MLMQDMALAYRGNSSVDEIVVDQGLDVMQPRNAVDGNGTGELLSDSTYVIAEQQQRIAAAETKKAGRR